MIILYNVPEIWHVTDLIFNFQFGVFCPFITPNNQDNQNFEKIIKEKPWRYYHFKQLYHKVKSYDVWLLTYEV